MRVEPRRHSNACSADDDLHYRVPKALQAVFLAGNRGEEVNVVPADKVAYKTFRFMNGRRFNIGASFRSLMQKQQEQSSEDQAAPPPPPPPPPPSVGTPLMTPGGKHHMHNHISPQTYLTSLLKIRGYSYEHFPALSTGYYNHPTDWQTTSYGRAVVACVQNNDVEGLEEALAYVSPNACNAHGESIVHLTCRLGQVEMLRVLLDKGARVQISDNAGQTPLHSVCKGAANGDGLEGSLLEVLDTLLQHDPDLLLLADARDTMPLQYLKNDDWTVLTKYLMKCKDEFWPSRDVATVGIKRPSLLMRSKPHSHPVLEPATVPSLRLVSMVAQGTMTPQEASMLKRAMVNPDTIKGESSTEESDEEDWDSDEESYDDDDESVSTFDEEEMADLLGSVGRSVGRPVSWS